MHSKKSRFSLLFPFCWRDCFVTLLIFSCATGFCFLLQKAHSSDGFASPIFVLAVLFCVICGIFIFSLGFVLTIPDNILGKLWALLGNLLNSGDSMGVFIAYCFDISKWLSLVGAIVSAISIVFIALTKRRNKTTKIVILSILMALFLVYFILQIITGGVQW